MQNGNGMENLKQTYDSLKIIPVNERSCDNCKFSLMPNNYDTNVNCKRCIGEYKLEDYCRSTLDKLHYLWAQYSKSKWKPRIG